MYLVTLPDGSSNTIVAGQAFVESVYPGAWELVEALEPPAVVPTSCTPAQGLIALFALKGIKETHVQAAIDGIADPVERYKAQIGYSRANVWERASTTMQALAVLLALTDGDLDELFAYAAGVQV